MSVTIKKRGRGRRTVREEAKLSEVESLSVGVVHRILASKKLDDTDKVKIAVDIVKNMQKKRVEVSGGADFTHRVLKIDLDARVSLAESTAQKLIAETMGDVTSDTANDTTPKIDCNIIEDDANATIE